MRLLKSLHGLRQSPSNWWWTLDGHLVDIGFKSLKSDLCVYIFLEEGKMVILTLYVDDDLLIGKYVQVLERMKENLMRIIQWRTWATFCWCLEWESPVPHGGGGNHHLGRLY